MFRGGWSDADRIVLGLLLGPLIIGFGVLFFLDWQHQDAQNQERYPPAYETPVGAPTNVLWWNGDKPASYQSVCERPETREEADLCQQWRSAESAARMVQIGQQQLWATWAGEAGLLATIILSFVATKAAQRATKIAEDDLLNADRPHLIIKELQIGNLNPDLLDSDAVPFLYRFDNHGKGPGWITGSAIWGIVGDLDEVPVPISEIAPRASNWPIAPGSWWGTMAISPDQTLRLDHEHRTGILDGTKIFYFAGLMTYTGGGPAKHEYRYVYQFVPKQNRFIPIPHPYCSYT